MARKDSKDNRKPRLIAVRDEELTAVAGGQMLNSAISQVMKNFGGALQTAARGG
jgi:hypothetical protein